MKKNKKPPCETNPFKEVQPKFDERKYISWADPYQPINHGKLGHSQAFKQKKPKTYYD
jgi:hypothetical protein